MEREACVCDHGFERSDLCAEIIIIIIIVCCVCFYFLISVLGRQYIQGYHQVPASMPTTE